MAVADVNGVRIGYDLTGGGGGTPLVMNHGFAGPARHWGPEIAVFAETRPLLMWEVRGHDRSTVPTDDGISLVEIDEQTFALLASVPAPRRAAAVVEEASHRGVTDAATLLRQLVEDQIVVVTACP